VISEEIFEKLLQAAESVFRPILLVAYDHGLRKGEILGLRWEQLDVREGVIRLAPPNPRPRRLTAYFTVKSRGRRGVAHSCPGTRRRSHRGR
jgi:integrase